MAGERPRPSIDTHTLRQVAAVTARPPVVIAAHGRHAQCVAFTRTGRILLSGGQDAQIRLWSVPGFHAVGTIVGHRNSVNGISFSPDEKWLATSSSDGTVRIWSFPEGHADRILQKQIWSGFSPSGRLLATISTRRVVTLWEVESGREVTRVSALDRRILNAAFTPDERTLLLGGTGRIHRVAIPDGGVEGSFPAHQGVVANLRVAPDGSTLASSGPPGEVRFWSPRDWALQGEVALDAAGMLSMAFAPDSSEVTVGVDFNLLTVNLAERAITARRRVGVKGVYGIAYSPDGRYLANAAADGKVRVWELERP